ncbi:class II glutamine amidotransferase [Ectopseudomonas oleovorans]|uniref:class II glutamine amidotransferase n=1 Tax=Ectopseudomonas oleovorans TaxID=301 RepID=UPI0021ADC5A6|nr:class II glutamine amidotransferase [Pseudomonas oleovorans]
MCELLGMSSRYPARLTSSLMSLAAHAGGSSRNSDGWGIALYDERDVAVFREAGRASESPLVQLLRKRSINRVRQDMVCVQEVEAGEQFHGNSAS